MWTGVYLLAGHAPSWHQQAMAAVLAGPEGTTLSHRAAAAVHGFRGYPKAEVEVACHRWHRAHPEWLIIHESCRLEPIDRTVVDGIPCTTRVRTLIDLGAVSWPDRIGVALDEERRRGNLELDDVSRRLEQLAVQGRNGIRPVRELLAVREGRALAGTGFEQLFLDLVRSFGLPEPERQWRVTDGSFVAYLDFAYPDRMIAIEADSEEYHLDLQTFHNDRSRQNKLSLLGWTFLRFTPTHLRHERQTVAEQVRSALGLRVLPTESSR